MFAEDSKPVQVLYQGRWFPGSLTRWKKDQRGWVGYVWWSEGVGLTHVEWVKAVRLRPTSPPTNLTFRC